MKNVYGIKRTLLLCCIVFLSLFFLSSTVLSADFTECNATYQNESTWSVLMRFSPPGVPYDFHWKWVAGCYRLYPFYDVYNTSCIASSPYPEYPAESVIDDAYNYCISELLLYMEQRGGGGYWTNVTDNTCPPYLPERYLASISGNG